MSRWMAVAVVVVLAAVWSAPAAAQVPQDTLPADSLAVDQTARFLEAQQQVAMRMPVLPQLGAAGIQPPGSRIVFDRDSIDWLHGLTLGDLLAQVPGTYLWRGGWYGRTESVSYRGRGVGSAEYFLDGAAYLPAGIDSVGVDPAFISLSFLDRVEIERLPGRLRIHLFTKRHDRLAPRSRIGITTGDADIARYEGSLERRTASGFGFALAADYLSSPTVVVQETRYSNNHFWLQGSYLPSPRFGVQYQVVRSAPKRRPFVTAPAGVPDTLSLGYDATRSDAQLRLSYHNRPDGLGASADVLYAATGWDGSELDQKIHQVGGIVALRSPTASFGGSAFYRSRWTPLDVRASAAWAPVGSLSGSVEAAFQAHDNDRSSRWTLVRAGFAPVRGFSLTGAARIGRELGAPALDADTTQAIRDYEAAVSWQRARVGLEMAYTRTSTYAPFAPAEFVRIGAIGQVPASEWLTVAVRVAPLRWVTLESWFSDPRKVAGVEGIPPTHSMMRGTIRSKFLRTFPSGQFDLKLQLGLESWGTGTIGRDPAGNPLALKGATFLRTLVQFQIGRFAFFWDRGNLTGSALGYVPGFRLPQYGTTFGVRWEFLN
jgi:hypothetical protein